MKEESNHILKTNSFASEELWRFKKKNTTTSAKAEQP